MIPAKKIAILLTICFSMVSCIQGIDLRSENGHLIVECVLTEDETQTLRLTNTENASVSLDDAIITLMDLTTNDKVGQFQKGEMDEYWFLDYSAIPGHKYQLKVKFGSIQDISAETLMPERPTVKHVVYAENRTFVYTETGSYENYEIIDPDNMTSIDHEKGSRYEINSLPEGPVWIHAVNCLRSGDYEFEQYDIAPLISTSLKSVDMFNMTGGIYDNESKDNFIQYQYVKGRPTHDKYLRIPSLTDDANRTAPDPNGYFSIAGSFKGFESLYQYPHKKEYPEYGYLVFTAVSDTYDRYLKELLSVKSTQESMQDFASLFIHGGIYTNINGGGGIFGAKSEQHVLWEPVHIFTYMYK